MSKQDDIFYSLPEIWDFCLDAIYDKNTYITGLEEILQSRGITKQSLILDAGCGSGFPSIDLIERGYRIIATDKSSEMVRQVQLNAARRKLSIEAYNTMWSNLSKQFGPIFDFLYCRGNSLVYAASWEQNWIVPKRSREEIATALENFYAVLKSGRQLYVDITHKDEKPYKHRIGRVETREGPVEITWQMEHNLKTRVRTWTTTLRIVKTGFTKEYKSYSYLLPHGELVELLKSTGFKTVEDHVPVKGEKNYSVFIASK
jgi:SAM-dependent methyltransferase